MRFIKMHGIGNDYVYVNGYEQTVDDPSSLARAVSDRNKGIGGDGLIMLLPVSNGTDAHVRMRMFNADGSEAEMCGNGIRCLCKLAHDHGVCDAQPMRIETGNGVLTLEYTLDNTNKVAQVRVDMGQPILEAARIPVKIDGLPGDARVVQHDISDFIDTMFCASDWIHECGLDSRITCVSMGNPHVVLYCDDVSRVPLEHVGVQFEKMSIFPNAVNVHFVQVHSDREVTMRTWERGSGITQACGTGASAVCVAGVLTDRNGRELLAHLPGGDLQLEWNESSDHVFMTGPATEVYTGVWPE